MDYYNDLDYYLGNSDVNMFAPGGRKKQGRRQNYVEKAPGAVSDYTRAATAQFMSQYADVGKIQENTRKAVERASAQRKSIAEDRMMKKGDFVKKHTDSLVKSAPKSSRASIKARQQQLKDMGLYKGKIDGKWGPLSIEAHNAALANGASWDGSGYKVTRPYIDQSEASLIPNLGRAGNLLSVVNPVDAKAAQTRLKELGLYDGNIDGNFGDASMIAHQKALSSGYEYKDGKYERTLSGVFGGLYDKAANAVRNLSDVYGFFNPLAGNLNGPQTPTGMLLSDLRASAINRLARKVTGNPETTLIHPTTITTLPDDQINVLRAHMMSLPEARRDNGTWRNVDYRRVQGNYAKGDRVGERVLAPEHMIANTLGQYSYYTDANGNVIVEDTYDFAHNVDPAVRGSSGLYNTIRDFAGNHGSKPEDPDSGKRHFRINLGNPNNGWKISN